MSDAGFLPRSMPLPTHEFPPHPAAERNGIGEHLVVLTALYARRLCAAGAWRSDTSSSSCQSGARDLHLQRRARWLEGGSRPAMIVLIAVSRC